MLLRSEGDDGDEVGDFHSFGSDSKKQKRKARKRKEEEASNMHFDVVTGELVVRELGLLPASVSSRPDFSDGGLVVGVLMLLLLGLQGIRRKRLSGR